MCYTLLTVGGVSQLKYQRHRSAAGELQLSTDSFTTATMQRIHLEAAVILGESTVTKVTFYGKTNSS